MLKWISTSRHRKAGPTPAQVASNVRGAHERVSALFKGKPTVEAARRYYRSLDERGEEGFAGLMEESQALLPYVRVLATVRLPCAEDGS